MLLFSDSSTVVQYVFEGYVFQKLIYYIYNIYIIYIVIL